MMPLDFVTETVNESGFYAKFIFHPLPAGFGHTLGNALRRTLLSSMEGAAVTYIKINDVVHPFTTITGIRESVLDLILNIKLLRFKYTGQGPFELTLNAKGVGKIKGGDFKGGDIQVVNKDQHIGELTAPKAKLDITLTVERGVGFSPSEEKEKKEFGQLAIDSVFSPVKKVNYTVEGARVGRKTNYDKLILEVWTDGSIKPTEALKQTTKLLADYFNYILSGRDTKKDDDESAEANAISLIKADRKVYQTIIDELDLPTRVINALLREGIETVEDLVKRGKDDLVNLKGVGKKSLDLIEKELNKLSVPFEDNE